MITALAAVLGALAAFGALVYAKRTIDANGLQARERLTYESVARLQDPALVEHKAVMSSFLRGGLQPPNISDVDWEGMDETARLATGPDMWRHLADSPALEDRKVVLQVLAYPNMLERLASMYNRGLLDDGIVKTQVEADAKGFRDQAEWWLSELKKRNGNYLEEIELMLHHLAGQSRPNRAT